MRVIFMGTPDFAVGTLEEIIKAGHEVVLVVSQPDKAVGRSKALRYTPVKACALEHGIEVYQPQKVRDSECIERLRTYHPDIIIVEAFGQIIPRAILDMPRYGCVNVHASLLPKYRGAAPIQWAVINGDTVTGVTTMRMDEGLDTGDMILKEEVGIREDETGGSLFDRLAEVVHERDDRILYGGHREPEQRVEQDAVLQQPGRLLAVALRVEFAHEGRHAQRDADGGDEEDEEYRAAERYGGQRHGVVAAVAADHQVVGHLREDLSQLRQYDGQGQFQIGFVLSFVG